MVSKSIVLTGKCYHVHCHCNGLQPLTNGRAAEAHGPGPGWLRHLAPPGLDYSPYTVLHGNVVTRRTGNVIAERVVIKIVPRGSWSRVSRSRLGEKAVCQNREQENWLLSRSHKPVEAFCSLKDQAPVEPTASDKGSYKKWDNALKISTKKFH